MFVSVILPIRNEASSIAEVLAAVLAQDYPHDLMEVIAVDGMSDDGTRDILRRLAAQDDRLRVLDNPQQIAPTALNLGIRAARGDVIVRVDGHGVLPPNYVRECVAVLSGAQGGQGGKRGSVVSRQWSEVGALLVVGGALDSVGRGCVGEAIAIAMGSRFGIGNSPFRTLDASEGPIQTDTVPYWAVRREAFERIGLFREEMLCHEDFEFNYRLRSAGGMILLLPWLRAKYYVRSTLGGLARQYWRYGIWKGRFLCSHPGSFGARHLIPPVFVGVLGVCVVAALSGKAGLLCLGLLLGLYGCFLLLATASLARGGRWGYAPMLPLALGTLHLCWGSGVWVGLLRGKVAGQPPRLRK
jgi:glycosyltransferase involved in cell wall biosynthesis